MILGNQRRLNPLNRAVLNVQLRGGVRRIRLKFTGTQHNFQNDKTEQISRWWYMMITVYTSVLRLLSGILLYTIIT